MAFEVSAAEWLPEDGATYTMQARAYSTSTLQCAASREVSVSFDLPAIAVLSATMDKDTGHMAITVRQAALADGETAMETCNVYRVVDGVRKLIAEGLTDGQAVTDLYAPLNVPFSYETASFANSGAVNQASYPGEFPSEHAFIYYDGGIAAARLSPEESVSVSPSFELFQVAGEEFPVAVFSDRTEEVHSFTAKLRTKEEAWEFYKMGRSHAPCVFKALHGQVFRCVCVPTVKPNLQERTQSWEVSVDVTRIAGGEL